MAETFDQFVKSSQLQIWVRSYGDWYGSIILDGPDTFEFILLIFITTNVDRTVGTTYRFEWISEQEKLVLREKEQTAEPVLDGDLLRIPIPDTPDFWFNKKCFSKLPVQIVEAFLDEVYRHKILSTLGYREQRLEVLRWLIDNKFPVYRHLRTPTDSRGVFEEVVFPPKLDF